MFPKNHKRVWTSLLHLPTADYSNGELFSFTLPRNALWFILPRSS